MSKTIALNEHERACVAKLAELYAGGRMEWRGGDLAELGLTQANYLQVMGQLGLSGVVESEETDRGPYFWFNILPQVLQVARAIELQKKKEEDDMNSVKEVNEHNARERELDRKHQLAMVERQHQLQVERDRTQWIRSIVGAVISATTGALITWAALK